MTTALEVLTEKGATIFFIPTDLKKRRDLLYYLWEEGHLTLLGIVAQKRAVVCNFEITNCTMLVEDNVVEFEYGIRYKTDTLSVTYPKSDVRLSILGLK